jgi:4-amino-4-deoxy-L-arabinose transferase-like glycosyltransferase
MKPYQIKRIERAALAVVMVSALCLRFAGLRWGLPNAAHMFSYHPDEAPLLGPVWYMLSTGDWDPHFYNYGTCYIYLVGVLAKCGDLIGVLPPTQQGWSDLHLLARVLTALMGTATIYLAYVIGKNLAGGAVGLGAAALLAVLPAHAVSSHYATVDVPATFFVMFLFVILLRLFGTAELSWYLLAGLALGLATATKYTMVIAVIPFVVTHFYASDDSGYSPPAWYPIAGLLVAALGFFAVTPYLLVLSQHGFGVNADLVRGVKFEMEHARIGGTFAFVDTGPGWVYHLLRSLPAAMGYIALAFGLIGSVLLIQRGRPAAVVLFAFALPYFGLIGAGKERFLRYMLPLLPVLVIAAVYMLDRLREASVPKLGKWGATAAPLGLGAACIVLTGWYAVQMVGMMVRPDVRDDAAAWQVPRATSRTKIGLASAPWYFTPPITPFNGGQRSLTEFHKWQQENPPYQVIVVGWSSEALRHERPQYFDVSDAEYADLLRLKRPDAMELIDALHGRYRNLKAFEPPPPLPFLRPAKLACPPDWLYTWPRIEIYY